MLRRWLIRSPLLLALAFLITVWVTSYFGAIHLYKLSGDSNPEVGAVQGLLCMGQNGSGPWPDSPLQFQFQRGATAKEWLFVTTTFGFYGGREPGNRDSLFIVFPLWLPTLLLALLNGFVWLKTRPKSPSSGFPIEPAVNSANSK